MHKRQVLPITGALLAALAFAVPASAESSKDSKIVLSGDSPTFIGAVDSSASQCIEGRKVKLLRITRGRDKVLGRARTNADGFFGIPHTTKPGNTYYAKVKRQQVTNGVFCGGDRSNRIKT